MVFLLSSLHTDLPLLLKWQGLQWYFNVFISAHAADLNKCDETYNVFQVFITAKELAKLESFQNEGMYWKLFQKWRNVLEIVSKWRNVLEIVLKSRDVLEIISNYGNVLEFFQNGGMY